MGNSILVVLGSPRKGGYSTYMANAVAEKIGEHGSETEKIFLNRLEIKACVACNSCRKGNDGYCIINDDMKPLYEKIAGCDALILACPVYWFSVNAKMKLFMDRLYGLHTERTKILKGKKIGVILSYGDDDPFLSGAMNAIRMFQDSFKYTESELCGVICRKGKPEKDRFVEGSLEREIDGLEKRLLG